VDKICENNRGVIVTVVATHNCVSCRGVKHQGASMVTTKASQVCSWTMIIKHVKNFLIH
jgi:GTP cyclohydrolase IA